MDRLRRRSALKRRAVTVPLESVPDQPSKESGIVHTLFVHERLLHVQQAMSQLNPLERRYIELSVFGEITHSEIAGQVDEPLGTVKTRIRRGLVKLRSILARTKDDD